MAFLRRWFLISVALVLSGESVFAASGSREERAFAAATAAFQDQNWSRAALDLAQFAKKYSDSTNVPAAALLLAQAQFKQGKFTEAMVTLNAHKGGTGDLADQYAYWLGEAQFAKGDFTNAAETFSLLANSFTNSPLRLTSVVEAAAAYAQLADWQQHDALLENTNGVFQSAAQLEPANKLILAGQLSRENSKYQQRDFSGVLAIYGLLTNQWSALNQEQQCQAVYLYHLANMELGDFAAALAATTNLAQLARSPTNQDWLATALAAQGAALKSLGRTNEAMTAYQQNLAPGVPEKNQQEAVLEIAALALAQADLTNAEAMLGKFINQFPASPVAQLALLTLGELRLKNFMATSAADQLTAAQTNFDQFIGAFTNSPLTGKACLDRGWCNWKAEKYPESLADFRAAAQRLPASSEDLAVAKFKVGDALYMLQDFSGARQNYQDVLDETEDSPEVSKSLGDRALYQILRTDLELKDADGADAAMRRLLGKYPASEFADHGLLLLGEGFSDFSVPTNALNVFRDFQSRFPNSALLPQVKLAVARTFERETNWTSAITNYEGWLKNYPTNELLPQVQYALGWANYQAGRETNAFQIFTTLVTQFPTNDLAPLAQWWMADYFYRAGNFVGAETNYELIFQTPAWKNSSLFYPAQLMAGRAAVGRLGFDDAKNYLTKLLADTNCPPPLATQAMFAYGGVLMRQDSTDTNRPFANFELATNVFAQICAANPTNELGALAGSELGDCYLQLGALDAATNIYAQVVNSPYASAGLRNRAQVGLGRTLEKKAEAAPPETRKALLDQALQNYQDVFETSYGKGLGDHESADAFWVKKAGLQMLPLLSVDNCPTNFFVRMEALLPPLKTALEQKKAALKN